MWQQTHLLSKNHLKSVLCYEIYRSFQVKPLEVSTRQARGYFGLKTSEKEPKLKKKQQTAMLFEFAEKHLPNHEWAKKKSGRGGQGLTLLDSNIDFCVAFLIAQFGRSLIRQRYVLGTTDLKGLNIEEIEKMKKKLIRLESKEPIVVPVSPDFRGWSEQI
eukprot:TRINITY_DN4199_c0_g1_i1.p1 TRINITY_DN4199_c0_g1~~TRINITY_DN4199_c0_g1_i1.p1  ORF type:complete len:160 (-),score=22.56 TRINITY_DN4199_c0_g1_i1:155-634(-)